MQSTSSNTIVGTITSSTAGCSKKSICIMSKSTFRSNQSEALLLKRENSARNAHMRLLNPKRLTWCRAMLVSIIRYCCASELNLIDDGSQSGSSAVPLLQEKLIPIKSRMRDRTQPLLHASSYTGARVPTGECTHEQALKRNRNAIAALQNPEQPQTGLPRLLLKHWGEDSSLALAELL